jgi:hypothetical protein
MQQPGLYFPFVHVRDNDWLREAALYWPSVRPLVPSGYDKHDSPTAQAFFDAQILSTKSRESYSVRRPGICWTHCGRTPIASCVITAWTAPCSRTRTRSRNG